MSEAAGAQPRRSLRRWQRMLLALLAVGALAAVVLRDVPGRILLAAEAYIFGYPLVVMDVTRAHAVATLGPENQLRAVRRFPDAQFRGVVRPNVDTLYTSAFIDMAEGPWLFEMPPNAQRYEVMPFMDAWTNVFASPGTRTIGTSGGKFVLAGAAWKGSVPPGHTLLRSPTRMVWLIGRTQAQGTADYPLVHRLQDGLVLRRLGGTDATAQHGAAVPLAEGNGSREVPPAQQMREMDTEVFFTRLARLMVDNPPAAADAPMVARLAGLGIAPGAPPRWTAVDRWIAGFGRWLADRKVARELAQPRDRVRGWSTPPMILGQYGTRYDIRAVVAMVGLGANLPADAIYPSAQVDVQGRPLDGSHSYRLRFPAGGLPPVKAFWSVTAYGSDDFLIDHPSGRHALGDHDPLVFHPDGSLELWIQADPPPQPWTRNWLPVRRGERFTLTARLYWPRESALEGRWEMPGVERAD